LCVPDDLGAESRPNLAALNGTDFLKATPSRAQVSKQVPVRSNVVILGYS